MRHPPRAPGLFGLALLTPAVALLSGCIETGPRIERLDRSFVPVREIESGIPPILEAARLPGLQVAIINDGLVVYTKGFGVKSVETGHPIDENTIFSALSFSKTIFAHLVLQLVGEGRIDLDKPLVSYLPRPLHQYEFYKDLEGENRTETVTARMALSHTTGLPNWRWFTPEGKLRFIFEPGERFSYSGEGIYLLQLVVEEITGEGLEDLARARLFEPLELERTSFISLPKFDDNYAMDHDRFLTPIGKDKRDEANAAGSVQTTAGEFAEFLAAVMQGWGMQGALRHEMSRRQVRIEHVRMFGPLSGKRVPDGEATKAGWGLGWGLVESGKYGRGLFHTGNDRGAANYHVAYPDRGIAVVLFGNSQTLEAAAPALTRLLIGDTDSPFGFLGYEPYDSAHRRLVEVVASEGIESGLQYAASLSDKGIGLWHVDEWDFFDSAGRDLLGLRRFDEVAGLYRHLLDRAPARPVGYERLAEAYVALEKYAEAHAAYAKALVHAATAPDEARRYRWKAEWIDGFLNPRALPAGTLREYAGDYDARHVELRGEALHYYRDDADDPTPRRMFPISNNTFVLKDYDSFRLRFERGPGGAVDRVTGLYENGRQDESIRDPS